MGSSQLNTPEFVAIIRAMSTAAHPVWKFTARIETVCNQTHRLELYGTLVDDSSRTFARPPTRS